MPLKEQRPLEGRGGWGDPNLPVDGVFLRLLVCVCGTVGARGGGLRRSSRLMGVSGWATLAGGPLTSGDSFKQGSREVGLEFSAQKEYHSGGGSMKGRGETAVWLREIG